MKTDKTCSKQTNQQNLETNIRNLRAEGKIYREIAQTLLVSISKISRILNEPTQKGEEAPTQPGEMASRVFQLLEKGMTLSQIVIKSRLEPEVVKDLHDKWIGLNQADINQPNLEKLDQKLMGHITDHSGLDRLLEKARNSGVFKRNSCANRLKNSEGICEFSPSIGEDTDNEDIILYCCFCCRFTFEERIIIEKPPYPGWPYVWRQ